MSHAGQREREAEPFQGRVYWVRGPGADAREGPPGQGWTLVLECASPHLRVDFLLVEEEPPRKVLCLEQLRSYAEPAQQIAFLHRVCLQGLPLLLALERSQEAQGGSAPPSDEQELRLSLALFRTLHRGRLLNHRSMRCQKDWLAQTGGGEEEESLVVGLNLSSGRRRRHILGAVHDEVRRGLLAQQQQQASAGGPDSAAAAAVAGLVDTSQIDRLHWRHPIDRLLVLPPSEASPLGDEHLHAINKSVSCCLLP